MTARRLFYAIGLAVLASSGAYVFIYLVRWEWNRAMFAALLFVVAEVVLLSAVVLDRLRTLSSQVERLAQQQKHDPQVLNRIRETAPPPSEPFAWLKPGGDQLGVFVPVLMGAGMVLSGLAWLVERIARHTATPALERGLATQLSAFALPDSLLPTNAPVALLEGPSPIP
jgi:hypothetical protein